ncbi:diacylglycerol kinase [Carboxylicivirga taeanensis]|uniref:diacylglycerol kinase n=1 Tax=Carboxylicivirga taeanensis TaxID=1416875 RepID=UPI003F6E0E52
MLCIALVLAMELLNSTIEALCDYVSAERHELIRKAKNMAAGAVLVVSIAAFAVGLIIFLPKILI